MTGTLHSQGPRAARAGSLAAVLDRYRPAALAVAALLAVVAVLPGADGDAPSASATALALGAETTAETATVPAAPVAEVPAALPAEVPADVVAVPEPAPAPDVVLDSGFAAEPAPAAPAPAPAAADPEPAAAPADPEPAPVRAESLSPLTVRASAWASRTAGTPLADQGVPATSLPVGLRVGVLDKASFVRLAGDTSRLVLREAPGGGRGDAAAVQVAACQVSDAGWEEGEAQSFDDAPAYDAARCATGARAASGTWTFDLTGFPTRTDARGFALVPAPDAPTDFQVAFAR